MAKILVADDNSNVQKTVALALADLGVEVVAVNNGDAAVKKLAEVMPDLVLADIFMPVRNGYEVCEYVKRDSRFSHMPVVLLVGAFDPLDEREAQRVGADGILKKPFVPPDPLIAMVKTLLDRSLGERMVTAAVAKPAVVKQSRAGGVAVADEHPSSSSEVSHASPSEVSQESHEANFRPPVDRLSFGDGERPVAFSQLLDSAASDTASAGTGVLDRVDDEQILTSSRDASLGAPIFWKSEEAERDLESTEAQEKVTSEVPSREWKLGAEDSTGNQGDDSAKPTDTLDLIRDDVDEEANKTSTIVESAPLFAQDAAAQASLTVDSGKSADLAANPIEWMASVPPPPEDEAPASLPEWSAVVAEAEDMIGAKGKEADPFKSESIPAEKEAPATLTVPVSSTPAGIPSAPLHETPPPAPPEPSIATAAAEPLKAEVTSKPISPSVEDTVHSVPRHDWTDLVASIQPKSVEPVAERPKPSPAPIAQSATAPVVNAQLTAANALPPALKSLPKSLENAGRSMPRLEWAELAASLQPKAVEPAAEKPTPAAPLAQALVLPVAPAVNEQVVEQPVTDRSTMAVLSGNHANGQTAPATAELADASSLTSTPAAPPDPALVEAVVQRVLEKMRPQVVDIITKEFLRPVVQALVHREITKR